MRKLSPLFTCLLTLVLTVNPALIPVSTADHHEPRDGRNASGLQGLNSNQLLPGHQTGISNKRAASLVKQKYSASRILGVSLLEDKGPPIYRVRTLSPNGVVKSVFVDGNSGEIFE